MQNPSNDIDPSEQKLREALEQVEVSDYVSPQPELRRTHLVKTSSLRPSQSGINTNINAEPLSAQISKDVTILQVASPLPEAELGNDKTILQIPPNQSCQDSPASVVLAHHVSLSPQKSGVVELSGSSFQPTGTVEAVNLTPNPIAQFSLEDSSNNLNAVGVTVIQNPNNCIIQHSDSVIQKLTNRTIIQYSDSAIHNPARTVLQVMPPSSTKEAKTFLQVGMPKSPQSSTQTTLPKNQADVQLFHPSIFRDMFRTSGSLTSRFISITGQFFDSIWRKIDLKHLQSRFHLGKQPSSSRINNSTHNVMVSEEKPSSKQYQEKLRELDLCRLSFAKELARNGNFRNAIAVVEQISETSHFFKEAQMLIQSWK